MTCVATYCARCYWYLLLQKFHPPFDHFGGGIFKFLEQMQMAVVEDLLARDGKLPDAFNPFQDLTGLVEFPRHWSKYWYQLPSGVVLYGEPDSIYQCFDGSIAVVDHKSALSQDGKDKFFPCYRIQTIGYSLIAEEGLKLGEVSRGAVFYWEAQRDTVVGDPGRYFRNGRLAVPFVPKVIEVEIDYKALDAPLKEVMSLWNAKTPPDRTKDCEDCEKVDAFLAIEAEVQERLALTDKRLLTYSANAPSMAHQVQQRLFDQNSARRSALIALHDRANEIGFAENGMVANWPDFSE
jgi:PD-(D/E)XK nuclease superfamily